MNTKKLNMNDLEKMAQIETDAVVEEQYNADNNYAVLDDELRRIINKIPFPETKKYTTGADSDEIWRLKYEKRCNEPFWEKRDIVEKYCDNGSLYTGHLFLNGTNYYIMDDHSLKTKTIKINGEEIWFINFDDVDYNEYVNLWRYPDKKVQFSRNITMQNRKVTDVDIVLDKSNEIFSDVSDSYLRRALIRNKNKPNIQSIIQTIQEK